MSFLLVSIWFLWRCCGVPGLDQPFGSHRATSAFGLETNRTGAQLRRDWVKFWSSTRDGHRLGLGDTRDGHQTSWDERGLTSNERGLTSNELLVLVDDLAPEAMAHMLQCCKPPGGK